jgi:hypothetical protein
VFEENTDSITRKLKLLIQISYLLIYLERIISLFIEANKSLMKL